MVDLHNQSDGEPEMTTTTASLIKRLEVTQVATALEDEPEGS